MAKKKAATKKQGNWRGGRPPKLDTGDDKPKRGPGRPPKRAEHKSTLQASVTIPASTEARLRAMMHEFPESARSRSGAITYLCDSALRKGTHADYPLECVQRVGELVKHYHPELAPGLVAFLKPIAERWRVDMLESVPVITGDESNE